MACKNCGKNNIKRQLLIGPDLGEFGWSVAVWAPLVRAYSEKFDQTIVVCKHGMEYLYADFCSTFELYSEKGSADRWKIAGRKPMMPDRIVRKYPGAEVRRPRKGKIMGRKGAKPWPRKYYKYGSKSEFMCYNYDIVIHARATVKSHSSNRNWPEPNYVEMLKLLPEGLSACSIGTKAMHIPGTTDRRGAPLKAVADILASSKVCVGSSSGPMHLASFCGCPHVVMTDDAYHKSVGGTNRDRYEKIWNPFKTICTVLDSHSWQPPPDIVADAVRAYL